MNPDPSRAEALFLAAAAIAQPQARSAFLDRECGDDLALRARVDGLLASHDDAGDFLQPAVPSPELEAELARLKPEEARERIGPYRLLQQIGEGGFGVVWMAEQEQPVRRRVALKIIKLGMDTEEVIARFEQERQALAMMDHPNIAKVFDAGATPFGRPYFVMELVRGIKLTDYCDEAKLPTAERLQLFIAVCQAVQHAHQKGIIHRDLKPSNILVTLHDGVPVPKVIDFGVAKAISARLTERTLFTRFEQMVGTPLYMSPEQAELSGLDIDTRSDIYSLGVLLYELLTGRTPVDADTLQRAGPDEVRRIIREEEPLRPSMVRSRSAPAPGSSRSGDPGRGRPSSLAADLDWIVMKALEKDRTRRYATANDLAEDLRRHLRCEPVNARPPSQLYRFRRMVARNKLAFAAGAAVAASIVLGSAVSVGMFFKEKAERQRAEASESRALAAEAKARRRAAAEAAARREAEAVTTYVTTIFQSPNPTRDGRTVSVAETLDRAATQLDDDLEAQPDRQAALRTVLGKTYLALGLPLKAIALHEQARAECLRTLGTEHERTIQVTSALAEAYDTAHRFAEALHLREAELALRRKTSGDEDPATIDALHDVATSLDRVGRFDQARQLRQQVVEIRTRLSGPEAPETLTALHHLAAAHVRTGRTEEGLQLQEQVLELRRKILGPEDPDTLSAISNLAKTYAALGRHDDALRRQQQLLELRRKVLGPEDPKTISTLHNLARFLRAAGRLEEPLPHLEAVLALRSKVKGPEHPETLAAMGHVADSCVETGRADRALALREQALALRQKALGADHPDTLASMSQLATSYRSAGRVEAAITLQQAAVAIARRVLPRDHPQLAVALETLAACYAATGRNGEADALRQELAPLKAREAKPTEVE
jgi:eukaryotic-like serine/threonine-protein kinase